MNHSTAVKTARRHGFIGTKKHGYLRYLPFARANTTERQSILTSLGRSVHRPDLPLPNALTTCSNHPTIIYWVLADRMSESPASRMAMVEQRKSLPQAVPSSICITDSSQPFGPSKVSIAESFFSGLQSINVLQSQNQSSFARHAIFLSSIGCGTYVVAGEVVDGGLAEHGVVLELRLAERRGVASNDDELGLAGAEGLEGGLVTQSDLAGLWKFGQSCASSCGCSQKVRTLIVSASLALMLSAVFAPFFGAIVMVFGGCRGRFGRGRRWSFGCWVQRARIRRCVRAKVRLGRTQAAGCVLRNMLINSPRSRDPPQSRIDQHALASEVLRY